MCVPRGFEGDPKATPTFAPRPSAKCSSFCSRLRPRFAWLDSASIAVAFTSLGLTILNTIYKYFVTKTFVNIYLLGKNTHTIVQLVYLIWNMVNDPLFGFLQDFGRWRWMHSRRRVIVAVALPIALSYMLFWIPWYPIYQGCNQNQSNETLNTSSINNCTNDRTNQWLIGMHLLVSMCLYDTFYSIMTSAQAGLFTEMTTEHAGRVRVVKYMEVAKIPGSLTIFVLERASFGLSNFDNVQIFNGIAALLATLCFLYTGLRAPDAKPEYRRDSSTTPIRRPPSMCGEELASVAGSDALLVVVTEKPLAVASRPMRVRKALCSTWQILKNSDFICITIGHFLRVMRTIGFASFLMTFAPMLVPREVMAPGSTLMSAFYLACDAVPKILIIPLCMVTTRIGPWPVVMGTIVLTLLNSIIAFLVGRTSSCAVLIFLFLEGTLSRCVYPSAYNIFVPEITNDDFERHHRKKPYSALIYSLNQMAIKPPNAFVKILIFYLIDTGGFYTAYAKDRNSLSVSDEATLKDTMFAVACFFPAAVAVAEAIALLPYRMRFKHLRAYFTPPCTAVTERTLADDVDNDSTVAAAAALSS